MIADHEALVALLAQSSGLERARAVVLEECERLHVAHPPTGAGLTLVVRGLAERSGAVGTSIRLALRREGLREVSPPRGVRPAAAKDAPTSEVAAGDSPLVRLLAPALGDEKAAYVVGVACTNLGLRMGTLSETDQGRVLDLLSSGSDYVATVARFAKARRLLRT